MFASPRRPYLIFPAAAALLAFQACSGGDLFSDTGSNGPAGNGGSSSNSSNATNGSSSSNSSNASNSSSSSSGVGGAGSTSVTSSSAASGSGPGGAGGMGAGGAPPCVHDECDVGLALDPMCSPCALAMCAVDPYCCDNDWDQMCVSQVFNVCGKDCSPPTPLCDAQYGTAPGHYSCGESMTECEFGFNSSQISCDQFCQSAGGECIQQHNNQGMCGLGMQVDCGFTGFMTAICICSLGCGGSPACTAPQTCLNGTCQ